MISTIGSYLGGMSGGSDPSIAEYQAILTEASADGRSVPSAQVQALQNQLIIDLKSTITSSGLSIWDELVCFECYLHDASTFDFGLYNWKDPAGFEASRVNSITWAANVGFTGNASNMIVNTGFNPTSHGGTKFVQNSAFMGVLLAPVYGVNASVLGTYCAFGSGDASSRNVLYYYTVGSPTWACRLNGSADFTTAFDRFTSGYYAAKRDATALTAYQGSSSQATTQASQVLVNNTVGVLGRKTVAGQDQCSSQTAHFFFAGSKYAEEGLREILEAYQTAVYQATPSTDTFLADYDFNDSNFLWTDAGKTTHPVDGEVIRAVSNKNGTWGDLTAAADSTAPLFQTAVQNGLNVAEWDGVDDNLDFDQSRSLGSQAVIFFVAKNDDATNGSHIISGSQYLVMTGQSYSGNPGSGPYFVGHPAVGNTGNGVTLKDETDGWNVCALRKNGTEYCIWNGRFQKITGTNANDLTISDMGANFGALTDWDMDGYIGRFIVKSGFMTDRDIENQIAALNTAYGL